MQLVSFREREVDAFSPRPRQSRLARRLPLSQLLREFLRHKSSLNLHLLEEDELPKAMLGRLRQAGLSVVSEERFFLHDRSPLRLAAIASKAGLPLLSEGEQKQFFEQCASFIQSTGRSKKDFALFPLRLLLPSSNFPALCLVAWRPEGLPGESLPWDKESLRDLQKQALLPPSHHSKPQKTEAVVETPPVLQEPQWGCAILGTQRSAESRKYYLRNEQGILRLALFSSFGDVSKIALQFARQMQAGESVLSGHKRLLKDSLENTPHGPSFKSLSLELTQDRRLQCINSGIPVLLWQHSEGRACLLPQTVSLVSDKGLQIRRLKGILGPEDGLLVLGGAVSKEQLRALASIMAVAGKGHSPDILKRAIWRKLDELGLGKALYFRYKKA